MSLNSITSPIKFVKGKIYFKWHKKGRCILSYVACHHWRNHFRVNRYSDVTRGETERAGLVCGRGGPQIVKTKADGYRLAHKESHLILGLLFYTRC